ncbi:MAG: hypothetical protein K0R41_1482 [Geminicoccaceae bacterium]|nr:hypothetical protein [Geminicoccaceae bacterium]
MRQVVRRFYEFGVDVAGRRHVDTAQFSRPDRISRIIYRLSLAFYLIKQKI